MSLQTLSDLFFAVVNRQQRAVMMHRSAEGWQPISSSELYRRVAAISNALLAYGISKGDRIAILGENRPEWAIADFASLMIGAVVVPIYPTLTTEQTALLLRDSGARLAFVTRQQQLAKVRAICAQTSIEKIVAIEPQQDPQVQNWDELVGAGQNGQDRRFDSRARALGPEDLATIIYTSGTTGAPKGVMLTHGNLAANIACSLHGFDIHPGQMSLSFLPLSHVTARHVDLALLYQGVTLAYVPSLEQLPAALAEIRPSILVGVPRFYEKAHAEVLLAARGFPRRAIYHWAVSVGRAHQAEVLAGRTPTALPWTVANRLVYSKVRAGMGGRVEFFISGGAPLGRELADWYAAVGIRIHEGYGLTETSPVIAVNNPGSHRLGTVGKPISNVEVRVANDGEILVRGPSVFRGYWNRPEETKTCFEGEWFRTGDIGNLDSDGFLSVTDRKKDLIKTSGGKLIAPQPIENSLKHDPFVADAAVIGDKRKFPAVLISPNFALLERWAQQNRVPYSSRRDLISNAKVVELYDAIVEGLNQHLARFEKLKKIILLAEQFSAEDGTLTASMKLRRRAVEERHQAAIESMYAQAERSSRLQPNDTA
jgi:long-chain acyl-CoA synthetase